MKENRTLVNLLIHHSTLPLSQCSTACNCT